MTSIKFPNMFSNAKTNLLENKEAANSNLKLVLGASKKRLLGDPDFGSSLKYYLYNQNSVIFQDIVIDEIYTCIKIYVPQIIVERSDITLVRDNTKVIVNVKFRYITDYMLDSTTIQLTEG